METCSIKHWFDHSLTLALSLLNCSELNEPAHDSPCVQIELTSCQTFARAVNLLNNFDTNIPTTLQAFSLQKLFKLKITKLSLPFSFKRSFICEVNFLMFKTNCFLHYMKNMEKHSKAS